jgi:hypothetical protein
LIVGEREDFGERAALA